MTLYQVINRMLPQAPLLSSPWFPTRNQMTQVEVWRALLKQEAP